MSTRERPLNLISPGQPNLRAGELHRMADAVERVTGVQGVGLDSGSTGLILREPQQKWVHAKLTAQDATDPDALKYSWTQVQPDGEGGWEEVPGGPSGDETFPAYERNNLDLEVSVGSPFYTRLEIFSDYMLFDAGASGHLTVEEEDGTPTYSPVYTLQFGPDFTLSEPEAGTVLVESSGGAGVHSYVWNGSLATSIEAATAAMQFNRVSGVTVSSVSSGVVRVAVLAASPSQTGAVTTGDQSFAGNKTFEDNVVVEGTGTVESTFTADSFSVLKDTVYFGGAPGAEKGAARWLTNSFGFNSYDGAGNGWGAFTISNDGSTVFFTVYDQSSSLADAKFRLEINGAFHTGTSGTDALGNVFRGGICTTVGAGVLTSGTVTSVGVSGGSTGLTTSGGPITSSGTITLAGTLAIANGGSGQTTANAALNAFLPSQAGNANKYLKTDGTNTSWGSPCSELVVVVNESSDSTLGLDTAFSTTNGSYSTTVLTLELPEEGTYALWSNVRGEAEFSAGTEGSITSRFYDSTASAVVPNSETAVLHVDEVDVTRRGQGSCQVVYEVAGASTIALEVMRDDATTWTSSTILSNSKGRTRAGWTRLF